MCVCEGKNIVDDLIIMASNASVNSSCAQSPPPPGLTPRNLPFFPYGWKIPGSGDESRPDARLYIMNQMRPVAKRVNSYTLKAPDLAILEFEF